MKGLEAPEVPREDAGEGLAAFCNGFVSRPPSGGSGALG